jgi:hypothetical protein
LEDGRRDDLFRQYAEEPEVKAHFASYVTFILERVRAGGFSEHSIKAEMSTHSKDKGRVHFHAVVSTLATMVRVKLHCLDKWAFNGSKPDVRNGCSRGRHAMLGMQRAHAYAQVWKEGSLHCVSNYEICKDFVCQPQWVMDWWRLRKFSHRGAILQLLRNRVRCENMIREVEYLKGKEQELLDKDEQWKVQQLLAKTFKPFKTYPKVTAWLQMFQEAKYGKLSRFRFLVLEGPSKLGETQLAQSFFGTERTLVINCQDVAEPNLEGYIRGIHKAIVFDEANWELVIKNKMLFQSAVDGVQVMQSRCQQFARWKFLYQTAMIVCTNHWLADDERTEHRDWLRQNSVLLRVRESCYRN